MENLAPNHDGGLIFSGFWPYWANYQVPNTHDRSNKRPDCQFSRRIRLFSGQRRFGYFPVTFEGKTDTRYVFRRFPLVNQKPFADLLSPTGHGAPALMTGVVDNFNKYPAFGSIVSRLRGAIRDGMPQYVASGLGGETPTAYLGKAHEPFVPDSYANSELMKSLKLTTTPERFSDRKALLESFDTLRRDLDRTLPGMDGMTASALEMISSGKVRDALDVTKEPEAVRAKYGKSTLWLRARRLVEAGVSFVTLRGEGDWDTHEHNFPRLRKLMPELDQAVHALVTDLHERSLDKDVAVVVWSEMGRTPKIGTQQGLVGGRDHFATGSVLMAGGGFKVGQTIGSTGPRGEKSTSIPYRASNVLATLYTHLGIDPATTLPDHNGRPMYLLDDRRTIAELV